MEAYPGSAIQLRLLESLPATGDDEAIILVHVLNPYGMTHARRFNENNVDLNRSFLGPGESYSGVSDEYRALHSLLNPEKLRRLDLFGMRVRLIAAMRGKSYVKRVVAGGQYEFPKGIFYGGDRPQPGPALYEKWLTENLSTVTDLFVIDVHTGLGGLAEETLLLRAAADDASELSTALGRRVHRDGRGTDVDYDIRGHHSRLYSRLGAARVNFITQEFGTYPPMKVLSALRAETWHHHHGAADDPSHPAKRRLKEIFAPDSDAWRNKVLEDGVALANKAATFVFTP